MKETTLEQFAKNLDAFLETAQHERIVVTRDGKPFALLIGIENKNEEDLILESSPEFWKMIEERRRCPTVPLDQVLGELLSDSTPAAG